jgi:hypothetical protein
MGRPSLFGAPDRSLLKDRSECLGQCNLQHHLTKLAINDADEEELMKDSTYSEALSIPQ